MMIDNSSFLEKTWDALLSREPDLIRKTFARLDQSSQKAVTEHLKKMVTEDGWQIEQVRSAECALNALEEEK